MNIYQVFNGIECISAWLYDCKQKKQLVTFRTYVVGSYNLVVKVYLCIVVLNLVIFPINKAQWGTYESSSLPVHIPRKHNFF